MSDQLPWQTRVADAVRAQSVDPHGESIDIDMPDGGIAFARTDERGRVRLSFFLAFGGDEAEYQLRIREWPRPVVGDLTVFRDDRGDAVLRLLVVSMDDERLSSRCRLAADVARMYMALGTHEDTADDLLATLAEEGLAAPPLAEGPRAAAQLGPWHWGTVAVPGMDLYMFELEALLACGVLSEPAFSLNHAGHGINSYGLTLLVTRGPVAAFVQHAFGGAYNDPVDVRDRIARTYARLHVLFNGLDAADVPPEWLLVHSQFRGSPRLLRLRHAAGTTSVRDEIECADETELFTRAVERLPEWHGNPAGVRVSW